MKFLIDAQLPGTLTRLNRDWSAVESAFSEGQQIVEMR